MRLRHRLTLALAILLVVGLAVAEVVTYTSLRSFLFGRLDDQLDVAQHQAYVYLVHDARVGRIPTERELDYRVDPDVYVMVIGPRGTLVLSRPSGSPLNQDPQPKLPSSLRVRSTLGKVTFGRDHGVYRPSGDGLNVGSIGRSGARYRVSAVSVPQGTLVTAISLLPTYTTLSSLVRVEILASLAVVLGICVLGLWIVSRGLRPLETMAATARGIAAGDLSRRVPVRDESTEVGQLGSALNTMLAQIEAAFSEKESALSERSASETRLRQFVADASHELRTPLTSIRGYTELLRRGAFTDDEGRDRALERVEHEATRMGLLVDDLLLLARLDQGRPLERTPVDLRSIGRDAVDDALAVDGTRPIDLVARDQVVVLGDRDRLGQVAHNLVRNALAHTPAGAPIRVEVERSGTMGVLRVVDHGPGLEPAQAARVFDRFYRGDAARTRGGAGLGLSIVRAIAEALGGSATVETTPGRGATFAVRIPLDMRVRRGDGPPAAGTAGQGRRDALMPSADGEGDRREGDRREHVPAAAGRRRRPTG